MPDEYVIPLSIDVAGIIQKASTTKTALTDVGEAAKKASSDSKQGFDNAGKSADDLSRKIINTTSQFSIQNKSIIQLKANMEAFKISADKATDPQKVVEYNRRVQELQTQITNLSNAGKKGFDDLGNKIDDNSKKVSALGSTFNKVATYIIAFFAIDRIISFAKEVAQVSAQAQGVQRAFDRINSPGLLSDLRAATKGTVSDLLLMQKAVLATAEGFPVDKLATIYAFSLQKARDLGKNTDDILNQLTQGILANSTRVLTRFGISSAEVKSEFKKTGDFTGAVLKVIQDDLNKTGDTADTAADRLARIPATITNIETNLGKNQSGVFAYLTSLYQQYLNFLEIAVQSTDQRLTDLGKKFGTQDNTKLTTDFKNDSPEERAKAVEGYTLLINKQTQAVAAYDKRIADVQNNLNLLQRIGRAAFTDLNDKLENDRDTQVVLLAEYKAELSSLQGITDQENQEKERQRLLDEANAKKEAERQKQLLSLRKQLNDQLVKLQNEYNQSEIAAIEDQTTKEVAKNDVDYQSKIKVLEQQKADLAAESKANATKFPELASLYSNLIRQINLDINKIDQEGQATSLAIIAKGAADKLKAQQDSIRAIGVLLKDETQARVDAINANYDKVIETAKKNGSLTTDYEKQLARQRQADISDVESKAILDRLTQQNELQVAFIESQGRRPGELQATFSLEQQRAILANDIAFQQKRIAVLSATLAINGSLTPDQTKQLADAAKKLNADQGQDASNKEADKANIFKQLGIGNDTEANIIKYGNAASQIGKITSDLFSNLAQGAENQVNAIQKQIDAINTLLQADQNAVDKQQSLYDKGRANSLDAAKKQLADDQAQKAALLKNQENAQKKAQELQKAQLVADTIAQTSNLITAATEIYKSVSVIPVIGPALAFAAVAAMFAGFAVAKVTAFNAVNGATQTAEEGGIAGGDRHSNGGNKYVSIDGKDRNILEIERGERIFSRKNSEKHKRLFEAIQNNDFSKLDIGDVSIQDLLRGTGVMQQLEVARMTGSQNITLQDRANNVVVIANNSDKYLSSIDKKMDNLNKKDPVILDMGDYVWIDYGNGKTERRYK